MNASLLVALSLGFLLCGARADPLAALAEQMDQTPTLQDISSLNGFNKGLRNLLQEEAANVALMKAAADGNVELVKTALGLGADPNSVIDGRLTPLIAAVVGENPEIVKILVEGGAKVDLRTKKGTTALEVAVANSLVDMVEALLEAGADPNNEDADGFTPLHRAAAKGDVDTMRTLVKGGGDHERKIGGGPLAGTTPLFIAVANAHLDLVRYFVRLGVDVNAVTTENMQAPLHLAAVANAGDVMKVLIRGGANVDYQDKGGLTPLMAAAYLGNLQAIEILLDAGANKRLKDTDGDTAKGMLCFCLFASKVTDECKTQACSSPDKMLKLLSV